MFTRRFYRIKAFQQLYAYSQEEHPALPAHEKFMLKSVEKSHELYVFLIQLLPEFHHFLFEELEMQRSKYIPSEETISHMLRLYRNKVMQELSRSDVLKGYVKHYKISWQGSKDVLKQLWNLTKQSEAFAAYMAKTAPEFTDDRKMILEWYQLVLVESELLNSFIEERYMNWEDDQAVVLSTMLKSIDKMKANQIEAAIMKENETDQAESRQFMVDLLRKTVAEQDYLGQLLSEKVKNWDVERIALTDMLLMKMALAEILYFSSIPVKVSINEYLELAKLYSTPQSHSFINGILDKVQLDLRKQNKIIKTGRGLVE